MIEIPDRNIIPVEMVEHINVLARTWRELQPRTDEMKLAQRSYDEDFLVRMAYNSNAIEGSTLTFADTEIVYEGEFVPDKPGREQVAARGLFEGAAFINQAIASGQQLDETTFRDLHERCALDLQPQARGMYRMAPAIIRASRTVPVSPAKIRGEMRNLFYLYEEYGVEKGGAEENDNKECRNKEAYRNKENSNKERSKACHNKENNADISPLERIAWFHAALESIHPFADGNGRTGRLWMNAQLQRCAYPPIAIKVDRSREYKAGLEAWQVDGEHAAFCKLFVDAVEEELSRRIEFLSQGSVSGEGIESSISHRAEALGVIGMQPTITAKRLGVILGVSERQAQRIIKELKDANLISRNGAKKKGTWVVKA